MAHQYLDGVTDVVIHWDDADGHYSAGQTLTGNIEVNVKEVTRFRGVVLKVENQKISFVVKINLIFILAQWIYASEMVRNRGGKHDSV